MVERVDQAAAYVLHQRPYRETSLLLEVFSRDYGRIGLVANGARRPKSRLRAVLQPLQEVLLSWQLRSDLGTLRQAESQGLSQRLTGDSLYAAFYMNELLMRLCVRGDPHPELYLSYQQALRALAESQEPGVILRLFERDLLEAIGYGLQLECEVDTGIPIDAKLNYQFDVLSGAQRTLNQESTTVVSGAALLALRQGQLDDSKLRKQIKQILQAALNNLLDNRPLRSVQMIRQMQASNTSSVKPSLQSKQTD